MLPDADLIFLASIASLHSNHHLLVIKILTGPQRHSGFSFLGKNKQTNKIFSFACMISLWFCREMECFGLWGFLLVSFVIVVVFQFWP